MRTRKTLRLVIASEVLALIVAANPARADAVKAPAAEQTCLAYDSAYESAPLFKIKPGAGQQRVDLYNQRKRCADDRPCASRQKSYLVTGDVVFASAPADGFRCVYYGTAKGHIIAGFVPVDNLAAITEERALSTEFVTGKWMYEGDSIEIKPDGSGQVSGEGQAYYQTAETVNEGEFEAKGSLNPGQSELVFKQGAGDTECVVTVRRRAVPT